MIRPSQCLTIAALCAAASTVFAQPFQDRAEVKDFIHMMSKDHGFNETELTKLFAKVEPSDKIIEAITRPAEAKPWFDYRPIFLTEKRIAGGVEFWNAHRDELSRAQERFGVPAQIVTAIIGVETYYGHHKGHYRVMDSLSTLAFDYPPRGKFFRGELAQFLLLTREEKKDPFSFMGSYAGAMGMTQFISSSFRSYAVDFDGDHKRDLWDSPSDAIGSVANYLNLHGWVAGAPIASAAVVHGDDYKDIVDLGLKPKTSIRDLRKHGVEISKPLPDDSLAALLAFETQQGQEFWVGLDNFYAITRYNHSPLYAMAVYQLGEEIRERRAHLALDPP